MVNVKIFISTHTHTFWSVTWILISILSFYGFFFFLDNDYSSNSILIGIWESLMSFITNYILLFLFYSGFILVDLGMTYLNNLLENKMYEHETLKEMELQEKIQRQRTMRSRKVTKYEHTGYDFDGVAGHDILIADTILKRLYTAIQN